jgi:hypothetical protein
MTKRIIKLKEGTKDTQVTLIEAVEQFICFNTAQGVASLTLRNYMLICEEFCPTSKWSINFHFCEKLRRLEQVDKAS